MKTFLKAHLQSLKLLILNIFILPWKIYSRTLHKLANDQDETDSDFWVLHWLTKCYDALIGLSYTIGVIFFFLALIQVVPSPIYEYSWGEQQVSEKEWVNTDSNYKYFVTADGDYYDDGEEHRVDKKILSQSTFYVETSGYSLSFINILICLLIVYLTPLYVHLIKEFFSIAIIQAIRISEIAKNTKK